MLPTTGQEVAEVAEYVEWQAHEGKEDDRECILPNTPLDRIKRASDRSLSGQ